MSGTEVTTEVQFDNNDDLDVFSAGFFGQTQADPAETNAETEQETVDEVHETVNDQTEETESELQAEYVEPPPKKKTVQDRIDEVIRQREEIRRDAEARLEAQKREFEARIAALEKPVQPTQVAQTGEPTPLDKTADGTEKYPLGEFDPQYIRDLTRYTLETERNQVNQRAQEEARERQMQEQRIQLQTGWNSKLETAKQNYPDLIEKGQTLINRFNNLEPAYSQYLTDTLMEMDHGPEVLYYLSSNQDEAINIINSGAKKATIALGRIEARFADAAAQKLAAKPKVTKAPTPPAVRARGTNGAYISVAPDTDDLEAFTREFFR